MTLKSLKDITTSKPAIIGAGGAIALSLAYYSFHSPKAVPPPSDGASAITTTAKNDQAARSTSMPIASDSANPVKAEKPLYSWERAEMLAQGDVTEIPKLAKAFSLNFDQLQESHQKVTLCDDFVSRLKKRTDINAEEVMLALLNSPELSPPARQKLFKQLNTSLFQKTDEFKEITRAILNFKKAGPLQQLLPDAIERYSRSESKEYDDRLVEIFSQTEVPIETRAFALVVAWRSGRTEYAADSKLWFQDPHAHPALKAAALFQGRLLLSSTERSELAIRAVTVGDELYSPRIGMMYLLQNSFRHPCRMATAALLIKALQQSEEAGEVADSIKFSLSSYLPKDIAQSAEEDPVVAKEAAIEYAKVVLRHGRLPHTAWSSLYELDKQQVSQNFEQLVTSNSNLKVQVIKDFVLFVTGLATTGHDASEYAEQIRHISTLDAKRFGESPASWDMEVINAGVTELLNIYAVSNSASQLESYITKPSDGKTPSMTIDARKCVALVALFKVDQERAEKLLIASVLGQKNRDEILFSAQVKLTEAMAPKLTNESLFKLTQHSRPEVSVFAVKELFKRDKSKAVEALREISAGAIDPSSEPVAAQMIRSASFALGAPDLIAKVLLTQDDSLNRRLEDTEILHGLWKEKACRAQLVLSIKDAALKCEGQHRDRIVKFGQALEQANELGMDFPFRYTPATLMHALACSKRPIDPGEKVALLLASKFDPLGALNNSAEAYQTFTDNGYVMLIREIRSIEELRALAENGVATTTEGKKAAADVLTFIAHGNQLGIALSEEKNSEGKTVEHNFYLTDIDPSSPVTSLLKNRGHVLLDACSTADGGAEELNFARKLRVQFPQAAPGGIQGFMAPLNGKELQFEFDKSGTFIKMKGDVYMLQSLRTPTDIESEWHSFCTSIARA